MSGGRPGFVPNKKEPSQSRRAGCLHYAVFSKRSDPTNSTLESQPTTIVLANCTGKSRRIGLDLMYAFSINFDMLFLFLLGLVRHVGARLYHEFTRDGVYLCDYL